ncbi:hypothetical protein BC937DRAFT_93458 [Endogone sp. FLAS-F59071]|nr:hypothetical protein BC937DRAFT_93458 [Endogone sp. FLAS-F59071]|eukprot:RUS14704.1 hypothetical protein BC937DRAFT_93458 [Endogone sp. FLAS-F59071]
MTDVIQQTETQPADNEIVQLLLDEGTKAFALHEYESAMQKYGEACQILDLTYGALSSECGDAYFLYGRALLNYAIQQSSVLGGRATKAADADADDADATVPTNNPRFHFEGDGDVDPVEEEMEDEGTGDMDGDGDGDGDAVGENEEDANTDGGPSSAAAPAEPEIDDFEYAWEVLDIARVIYARTDTDEARLKLADVYLCLGDISMETEKFDQAIHDFREAIKLKSERLSPSDRQLAEAHYKLALVLEYSSRLDEQRLAVEHTEMAVRVLKNRVEVLKKLIAEREEGVGKGKGKEGEGNSTRGEDADEKEVVELEELIPDMEQKAEDLRAAQYAKDSADDLLREVLAVSGSPTQGSSSSSSSAQPVHDLNSLIKRKPKQPGPMVAGKGAAAVEGVVAGENTATAGESAAATGDNTAAAGESTVAGEREDSEDSGVGVATKRKVEEAKEGEEEEGEEGVEGRKKVKM